MNPIYNNLSKTILDYTEKYSSFDFDFDVEDLSFKVSVTKNDCTELNESLFGFEINIFNESLDYTLIDYSGDVVRHQYYDNFDYDSFVKLFDSSINLLINNNYHKSDD